MLRGSRCAGTSCTPPTGICACCNAAPTSCASPVTKCSLFRTLPLWQSTFLYRCLLILTCIPAGQPPVGNERGAPAARRKTILASTLKRGGALWAGTTLTKSGESSGSASMPHMCELGFETPGKTRCKDDHDDESSGGGGLRRPCGPISLRQSRHHLSACVCQEPGKATLGVCQAISGSWVQPTGFVASLVRLVEGTRRSSLQYGNILIPVAGMYTWVAVLVNHDGLD